MTNIFHRVGASRLQPAYILSEYKKTRFTLLVSYKMTTKVVYKEYNHYLYHMIKDFTTYQQALKLKELGFDEPCFGRWWFNTGIHKLNEEELEIIKSYYFGLPEYYILAPTFSQAFRFFREKYGLQHDITLSVDNNNQLVGFYILIHKFNPLWNEDKIVELEITTTDRDEAELACIEKLIELTFKSE